MSLAFVFVNEFHTAESKTQSQNKIKTNSNEKSQTMITLDCALVNKIKSIKACLNEFENPDLNAIKAFVDELLVGAVSNCNNFFLFYKVYL